MLLLDLDNTLFHSVKADQYSIEKLSSHHRIFGFSSKEDFLKLYEFCRKEIKKLLPNQAENRFRLFYFKKMSELKFDFMDTKWIFKLHQQYQDFFKEYIQKDLIHYKLEYKEVFDCLEKIQKKSKMIVVTNGVLEVQLLKLQTILPHNIKVQIVCSQEVGYEKPSKEIFSIALKHHQKEKNLMIGDSYEDDVLGSLHSNFQAIHLTKIFSANKNYTEKKIKDSPIFYKEMEDLASALKIYFHMINESLLL